MPSEGKIKKKRERRHLYVPVNKNKRAGSMTCKMGNLDSFFVMQIGCRLLTVHKTPKPQVCNKIFDVMYGISQQGLNVFYISARKESAMIS